MAPTHYTMSWSRFKQNYFTNAALGLSLDISRMPFPDGYLAQIEVPMKKAFADMAALEKGAIANPVTRFNEVKPQPGDELILKEIVDLAP